MFSNCAASKKGEILSLKTKRILKMNICGSGYYQFSICDEKFDKPKKYYQHRFVYESIRSNTRGMVLDHINNCKTHSRLKNLQLLTQKENNKKSNNKSIISINLRTSEEKLFVSIKTAAIELNIDASSISAICRKVKSHKTATSKKHYQKYTFILSHKKMRFKNYPIIK